jgi:peptide/nickel transport system substrate-binding protein
MTRSLIRSSLFAAFVHSLTLAATVALVTQAQAQDRKTFIFARGADAQKLDPADVDDGESIKILVNVCEGLLRFKDGTTEVEPCLAESWTTSDDGKVYTFKLRKGVKFHDGTPLNAETAVWSFHRQMDARHPAHFASAKFEYWGAMYSMVESVKAADAMTVEIRLKEPHAPFLLNMAMFPVSLLSPAALATYGEKMQSNPVGTGPFKFREWKRGERVVLEANDDYWGGRPKIDRLIFKVVPDNAARFIQLKAGEIHAMDGLDPNNLDAIERDPNLKLVQSQGINVCYLSLNCEVPPFNDKRVRQAVAMAIRKKDLIASVYRGTASAAVNPMPPIVFGFNDKIKDYNVDTKTAEKLFESYTEDPSNNTEFTLPFKLHVMSNPRPYLPNPTRAAELIKGDLERIGLKVQIVTNDWGTHLAKTRNGEHQMALLGWISDNGDPDNFLGVLLSSATARKGSALNISFYKNPKFDELIDKAKVELNPEKRAALYKEAQEIIHDDCPMIPLAHVRDTVAMRKNVQNLRLAATGDIIFRTVYFGEK